MTGKVATSSKSHLRRISETCEAAAWAIHLGQPLFFLFLFSACYPSHSPGIHLHDVLGLLAEPLTTLFFSV